MLGFNRPTIVGRELDYIRDAFERAHLSSGGYYTHKCERYLETMFGAPRVLLTTSCTAALEMAALLCEIGVEDEVLLPSYTFVSTANAFALRGARLKFIDIRPDTLNLDEAQLRDAVNERTKVIVPVHYAGLACDMDPICDIAQESNLLVVEDAAQAISSKYKDRALGTIGQMATFSFHETKNITCGEGGALVLNDSKFVKRAEFLHEKGTNRRAFLEGQVDKYTWIDLGSSYGPSEILAAFLLAQLEKQEEIAARRRDVFESYVSLLTPLAQAGHFQLPRIPDYAGLGYHMFYLLLDDAESRPSLVAHLKRDDIQAVFHYVPLHSSPMGRMYGYRQGMLPVTESISERLIRLPLHLQLSQDDVRAVADSIYRFFGQKMGAAEPTGDRAA